MRNTTLLAAMTAALGLSASNGTVTSTLGPTSNTDPIYRPAYGPSRTRHGWTGRGRGTPPARSRGRSKRARVAGIRRRKAARRG